MEDIPSQPIENPPANKKIAVILLSLLILLLIGLIGYLYSETTRLKDKIASMELEFQTKNDQTDLTPTADQQTTVDLSETETNGIGNTSNEFLTPYELTNGKFTHPELPGFEMAVPTGWAAKIKPFDYGKETDIESNYFPTCSYNCMHLTLEKGDTKLNLNFDKIMDNNGFTCGGGFDVDQQAIGNGWYRMYEGLWYIYAYKPNLNVPSDKINNVGGFRSNDIIEPFQEPEIYDLCSQGSGYTFIENPPTEDPNFTYGLMLEFPTTRGNPDIATLNQIDQMITSIKGLAEPFNINDL